jgi:CDP-diacylglycerol--glycerol-3-phosphate 3-phosphatidyltransferase
MLSQVLAVAFLIASSASGAPPVANFGEAFPAIQFWSVPELRTALTHLFSSNNQLTGTDFQVLLYTAGRAMLWVVVLSACYSMYQYFRAFYLSQTRRTGIAAEAGVTVLPPRPAPVPPKEKKASAG